MDKLSSYSLRMPSTPPTENLKYSDAVDTVAPKDCKFHLTAGVFFDGTGNNEELDVPRKAHSNIVRLSKIYPESRTKEFGRIYVPGVGTPFPHIGENVATYTGTSLGFGCEQRILWAILMVLNNIHIRSTSNPYFSGDQVKILATSSDINEAADKDRIRSLGLSSGLFQADKGRDSVRVDILKKLAALVVDSVQTKWKSKLPCKATLDVFGFSRGAAQARVFCSWMEQQLEDGKFAGVPLEFRFLGLFDTVASASHLTDFENLSPDATHKHRYWAKAEDLRIPSCVRNCVHMVAMHEFRKTFALDEILIGGEQEKGRVEVCYPGAHSDVGGGYKPCELGVSYDKDDTVADGLKLSQITLNHMLACATALDIPFNTRASTFSSDFAIDIRLKTMFDALCKHYGNEERPLHGWGFDYLAWRWQKRLRYDLLKHVNAARPYEQIKLKAHNLNLIEDAQLLIDKNASVGSGWLGISPLVFKKVNEKRAKLLAEEAWDILSACMKVPETPRILNNFFDLFVHDSMAGYDHEIVEPNGYWRYRRVFQGDDEAKLGLLLEPDLSDEGLKTA